MLRKARVPTVRCILEYGAQVWHDIPPYLSDKLESVQRNRALSVIYPYLSYADALSSAQTTSLAMRRSQSCMKYIQQFHNISHPNHSVLLPSSRGHPHDYNVRTKTTSNTKACCALIYYLQSSVQCVNDKSSSILCIYKITKIVRCAFWLVTNLWFIVLVNS